MSRENTSPFAGGTGGSLKSSLFGRAWWRRSAVLGLPRAPAFRLPSANAAEQNLDGIFEAQYLWRETRAAPDGARANFRTYPALRLRLRAGLTSFRPCGAFFLTLHSTAANQTWFSYRQALEPLLKCKPGSHADRLYSACSRPQFRGPEETVSQPCRRYAAREFFPTPTRGFTPGSLRRRRCAAISIMLDILFHAGSHIRLRHSF